MDIAAALTTSGLQTKKPSAATCRTRRPGHSSRANARSSSAVAHARKRIQQLNQTERVTEPEPIAELDRARGERIEAGGRVVLPDPVRNSFTLANALRVSDVVDRVVTVTPAGSATRSRRRGPRAPRAARSSASEL